MGKGRAAGRVGSGQTFCRQARVGSGQRFAGSGRVGSKKSDPWTTLCEYAGYIVRFVHPGFEFQSWLNIISYPMETTITWGSLGTKIMLNQTNKHHNASCQFETL